MEHRRGNLVVIAVTINAARRSITESNRRARIQKPPLLLENTHALASESVFKEKEAENAAFGVYQCLRLKAERGELKLQLAYAKFAFQQIGEPCTFVEYRYPSGRWLL